LQPLLLKLMICHMLEILQSENRWVEAYHLYTDIEFVPEGKLAHEN